MHFCQSCNTKTVVLKMGARRQHAPRHGALRFLPRKRARSIVGRIRNWRDYDDGEPRLLGFAGFKAGMTHISYIEDEEESPYKGLEISSAVTIIETPPLVLYGIKALEKTDYGLLCRGQLLASNINPILGRKIILPKEYKFEEKKVAFEKLILDNKNIEIRGLFYTQPKNVGVSRKKPDTIEIKVSGGKNPWEQ